EGERRASKMECAGCGKSLQTVALREPEANPSQKFARVVHVSLHVAVKLEIARVGRSAGQPCADEFRLERERQREALGVPTDGRCTTLQRVANRHILVGEGAEAGNYSGVLAGIDMHVEVLDGAEIRTAKRDSAVANVQLAHWRSTEQIGEQLLRRINRCSRRAG